MRGCAGHKHELWSLQINPLYFPLPSNMLHSMYKTGRIIAWSTAAIICGSLLLLSAMFLYLTPQIPDAATFKDVKIRAPMRIYSADGKLIQEFGERLTPIRYEEIPPLFVRALLDTED